MFNESRDVPFVNSDVNASCKNFRILIVDKKYRIIKRNQNELCFYCNFWLKSFFSSRNFLVALCRLARQSNFYMAEYCENLKMAFSKILDFIRRLKTRFKAPTGYNVVMTAKVKTAIGCYFLAANF